MPDLSDETTKLIKEYFMKIPEHESYFASAIDDRKHHKEIIEKILKKEELEHMSEVSFSKLISSLWASGIWVNKDYLVNSIISSNGGIEKIRNEFIKLLYGQGPFIKRFDEFDVKRLGSASTTEILCMFSPDKYGIWNVNTRNAFEALNFIKSPFTKYNINGEEYEKINAVMIEIGKVLKELKISEVDLLTVDYFLYQVSDLKEKGTIKASVKKNSKDFDHDEIRDYLSSIGGFLGFESDIEYPIANGARVDAIWTARIGNLGAIKYVFEVQKSGSIDSLILNLQRARSNATVQKVVAVSNSEQLDKIKSEVETLSEEFRKSLVYWDQENVVKTYEMLSKAQELMADLGLTKSP